MKKFYFIFLVGLIVSGCASGIRINPLAHHAKQVVKPMPVEIIPQKSIEPPIQPSAPNRYYAVLESESVYSYQGRTSRNNYLMIAKTQDRATCASLVRVPKEEYVFADCLKNESQYDQVFQNRPIGEWYVRFQAADGTEKAVIIKFGMKRDAQGKDKLWDYQDSLEVTQELRDKIDAKAQAAHVNAKIRIFSPTEELKIP